ncbi:hypothetical protein GCM10010207_51920 [Streptomyces atratus]|nr:hypothetical protein GCM10010207_51920 [Streptomyces atratus]
MRDRLVHILRGNGMFQAYWAFMRALADAPVTVEGVDVAEDFHRHLVDPRLRSVFATVSAGGRDRARQGARGAQRAEVCRESGADGVDLVHVGAQMLLGGGQ